MPLPNCFRNRCSTPQKQPAATVAFWMVSDILRDWDSGAREKVGALVENGRRRREKRVEVIGAAKDICRIVGTYRMRSGGERGKRKCTRCGESRLQKTMTVRARDEDARRWCREIESFAASGVIESDKARQIVAPMASMYVYEVDILEEIMVSTCCIIQTTFIMYTPRKICQGKKKGAPTEYKWTPIGGHSKQQGRRVVKSPRKQPTPGDP